MTKQIRIRIELRIFLIVVVHGRIMESVLKVSFKIELDKYLSNILFIMGKVQGSRTFRYSYSSIVGFSEKP